MRKAATVGALSGRGVTTVAFLIGRTQTTVLGATHRRRNQKKCGPLQKGEEGGERASKEPRGGRQRRYRRRGTRKSGTEVIVTEEVYEEVEEEVKEKEKEGRWWKREENEEAGSVDGKSCMRLATPPGAEG